MIDVGINENVVLTSIKLNDKDMLEISFDELSNLQKSKTSIFDDLQTAKVENDGMTGKKVNMFTFKWPASDKLKDKTEDELLEMVSDDMKARRSQLTQLMEIYLPQAEINKVWDVYKGTGVDGLNYRERLKENDTLKAIWHNFANQTIELLTPFFGNLNFLLRLKLIRQSKEKHFAEIPKKFLQDYPFVELMEVPAPKVKFSPYELREGLNDATPMARPAATEGLPGEQPAEGVNVFGARR